MQSETQMYNWIAGIFLLIAIIQSIPHLWRRLHRPGLMSAQPTNILMRLRISVVIAVYGSLKD